jgi:hypothetical protein
MTNWEGSTIDNLCAKNKGPRYRYFRDKKFLPNLKDIFDNPPQGKEEEF